MQSNPKIRWICMVYHETSTSSINPVQQVGEIAARYQRHLFVDCISAVGAQDIDVMRDHIDVCSGSANKAIAGPTGISFVLARRSLVPRLGDEVPRRNMYLNLQKYIEWSDKCNQTPNTPAVTMFIGLDIALQELLTEGLENRIKRYQECASVIRDGVRALGLSIFTPDNLASNTLTTIKLPPQMNLSEFIDEMERRGYVLYPGKGSLEKWGMFQISNMGWISVSDCHQLLKELAEVIRR